MKKTSYAVNSAKHKEMRKHFTADETHYILSAISDMANSAHYIALRIAARKIRNARGTK
jgi:hypothetical protein